MAAQRRLIVIGGSAGSIPVLKRLAADLPEGFSADILVVVHLSSGHSSSLAALLASSGPLEASFARNCELLTGGRILVAPPNYHLLVRDGAVVLSRGPKENLARPAIDPLFRTAAAAWGALVIGVVLSGRMDDGTAGLRAIKQAGGVAVVQDPADADNADMPQSALDFCEVDHVVPAVGLAEQLVRLVAAPPPAPRQPSGKMLMESSMELDPPTNIDAEDQLGSRSVLSCPECGGVLWAIDDGGMARYRCHTGHAYTAEAMNFAQGSAVEKALWSAVRLHRERVELARQMIAKALARGHEKTAELWQERVEEYDREADVLLSLLLKGELRRSA